MRGWTKPAGTQRLVCPRRCLQKRLGNGDVDADLALLVGLPGQVLSPPRLRRVQPGDRAWLLPPPPKASHSELGEIPGSLGPGGGPQVSQVNARHRYVCQHCPSCLPALLPRGHAPRPPPPPVTSLVWASVSYSLGSSPKGLAGAQGRPEGPEGAELESWKPQLHLGALGRQVGEFAVLTEASCKVPPVGRASPRGTPRRFWERSRASGEAASGPGGLPVRYRADDAPCSKKRLVLVLTASWELCAACIHLVNPPASLGQN